MTLLGAEPLKRKLEIILFLEEFFKPIPKEIVIGDD